MTSTKKFFELSKVKKLKIQKEDLTVFFYVFMQDFFLNLVKKIQSSAERKISGIRKPLEEIAVRRTKLSKIFCLSR